MVSFAFEAAFRCSIEPCFAAGFYSVCPDQPQSYIKGAQHFPDAAEPERMPLYHLKKGQGRLQADMGISYNALSAFRRAFLSSFSMFLYDFIIVVIFFIVSTPKSVKSFASVVTNTS